METIIDYLPYIFIALSILSGLYFQVKLQDNEKSGITSSYPEEGLVYISVSVFVISIIWSIVK